MSSIYYEIYYDICDKLAVDNISDIRDPAKQYLAVQYVNYKLTGQFDNVYTYGLQSKMFDPAYDFNAEWDWVYNDFQTNGVMVHQGAYYDARFNLGFIDQNDHIGVHRHGWQFVYKAMEQWNNNSVNLMFDLYIDRSFHWKLNIMKMCGIVPYVAPWFGFIHHTFDESFSINNCMQLFQCPEFIASLPYCKGLFTLSHELQKKVRTQLVRLGYGSLLCKSIFHPVELNTPSFDWQAYQLLPIKQIVHIGGWMRNVDTFFQLNVGANAEKILLQGKFMENYYPPQSFIDYLNTVVGDSVLATPDGKNVSVGSNPNYVAEIDAKLVSEANDGNTWVKFFLGKLQTQLTSVSIQDTLPDNDYDDFLLTKIVFIHLIDASAVNTILECIAGNIPIIVNRLPAIEEYIGSGYPLFIPDDTSVQAMSAFVQTVVATPDMVHSAVAYLASLDKTKFLLASFESRISSYIDIMNGF